MTKWISKKWRVLANFFASGLVAVGLSFVPVHAYAADHEVSNWGEFSDQANPSPGDFTNGNGGRMNNNDSITLDGGVTFQNDIIINRVDKDGGGTVTTTDLQNITIHGDNHTIDLNGNGLAGTTVLNIDHINMIASLGGAVTVNGASIATPGILNLTDTYWAGTNIANGANGTQVNLFGANTLAAGNTYSNGTTLNDGSATTVSGTNAFGSGNVDVATNAESVVTVNDTASLGNDFSKAAGSQLTFNGNGSLNVNGNVDGVGALVKDGTGVVTLGSGNTHSGSTTVNRGDLVLAADASLSNSTAVNIQAGGRIVTGTGTTQSLNQLSGKGELHNQGDTTINGGVFDGTISGSGDIATGVAATTFGGKNTYTGTTTVGNGGLSLTSDDTITESSSVNTGGALSAGIDMSGTKQTFKDIQGVGGVNLGTGGHLNVHSGNYSGVITGAGSFTKSTAGDLFLGTQQVYTGKTEYLGGITTWDANNVLAASSGVTIGRDATVKMTNNEITQQTFQSLFGEGTLIGGTVVSNPSTPSDFIPGNTNFIVGGGNFAGGIVDSSEFDGVNNSAFGGASLTIGVGNSFTLSGSNRNTYSGDTTINGTLFAGAENAFGFNSNHVVVGTLDLRGYDQMIGSLSGIGVVELGGGKLSTNFNGPSIFDGTIRGAGDLFVEGDLTLGGVNSYSGRTVVTTGNTLDLTINDSINSSSELKANGAVTTGATSQTFNKLTGNGLVSNDVGGVMTVKDAAYDGTLTVGGTANLEKGVYNGVIDGAGVVNKTTDGTLTLNGANTFAGLNTDGGTVEIGNDGALGAGDVNVISDTTFATINGAKTVANNFTINSQNNTPQTADFDTTHGMLTLNGVLSGDGNLAKTGTGTLILGNTNTFTGKTFVDSGILTFTPANNDSIASSSELHVERGGAIDLAGTLQTVRAGHIVSGTEDALRGAAGSVLRKIDGTTLYVDGSNAGYGGTTSIEGGTISANNGQALGSQAANTIALAGGTIQGTENITLANNITADTNAANAIEVVSGKEVRIAGSVTDIANPVYDPISDPNSPAYDPLDPAYNPVYDPTNTAYDPALFPFTDPTLPGTYSKTGNGTLVIDGKASNSGTTFVHGGTLQGGNVNSFSENSLHDLDFGAVLDLGGKNQQVGSITGSSDSEIRLGNGTLSTGWDNGDTTYSGVITGTKLGGLNKTGSNTLTLDGSSTYAGSTTFSGGAVAITKDENLGVGGDWVMNGGTLAIDGTFANDRKVIVNENVATGGIDVATDQTVTLNGVISDQSGPGIKGSLIKDGDGKLVLLGKNTNDSTVVNGGILEGSTDSLQGTITTNVPGKTVFNQNFDGTYNYRAEGGVDGNPNKKFINGELLGGGTIEKRGNGQVKIVTDNSNFAGTTNVFDGTLRVDVMYAQDGIQILSAGLLGGNVVVAPDEINSTGDVPVLSGNGTILGDVDVKTSGFLAPKNLTADWKPTDVKFLDMEILGDLTFEKTQHMEIGPDGLTPVFSTLASDNAGTFAIGINNYSKGLNALNEHVGVSDFVSMNGGLVTLVEGQPAISNGAGQVITPAVKGTQLAANSFSEKCSFNYAYVRPVRYTIIEGAGNIEGDFQKRYDAEGNVVFSKDGHQLLDVAPFEDKLLPRFLGFHGEKIDADSDLNFEQYDLVLGMSEWDFHTPVEAVPVSGIEKPYAAGSHNQSEAGNALNCVLRQVGTRFDAVNNQWNTFNNTSGIWSNTFAYQDSLWNAELCRLGDQNITVGQYREAYNQLVGDLKANSLYIGMNSHYRNAFNHFSFAPRYCNTCNTSTCGDSSCGTTQGCGTAKTKRIRNDIWFDGDYIGGRYNSDGNSQAFNMNSGGFMIGMGREVGCRGKIGIMAGYTNPEVSNLYGKIDADDFTIGLYGGTKIGPCLELLAYAGAGFQDYDSERNIYSNILVDSPTRLNTTFDGHSFEAAAELGMPLEIVPCRLWVRPFVAVDYRAAWQDAAAESGHDILALEYAKSDFQQLFGRLGVSTELVANRCLTFRGRLAWEYQMLGNGEFPSQDTAFIGAGYPCNMDVRGVDLGDSRFAAGGNIQWYLNSSRTASILGDYEISAMDRGATHHATLGYIQKF